MLWLLKKKNKQVGGKAVCIETIGQHTGDKNAKKHIALVTNMGNFKKRKNQTR